MPNWCYNSTAIHGDHETLTKFVDAITVKDGITVHGDEIATDGRDKYDLTLLHPVPEELRIRSVFFSTDTDDPEHLELTKQYEANIAKYGHRDWYDWSIENWGTKWSPHIDDDEIDIYEGRIVSFSYDTAWSPPTALLRKISEIFPTLLITNTFDEEGMGFWGCEAFHGGKEVSSYGMSDGEMPEVFADKRKAIEERYNSDDEDERWEAHGDLMDVGLEMKEHCEEVVYLELRRAGLLPSPVI